MSAWKQKAKETAKKAAIVSFFGTAALMGTDVPPLYAQQAIVVAAASNPNGASGGRIDYQTKWALALGAAGLGSVIFGMLYASETKDKKKEK